MKKLEQQLNEIHQLEDAIKQDEVDSYGIAKISSWVIGFALGVSISYILFA